MPHTILAVASLDGTVTVPLPDGTVLVLTQAEWQRGVRRGEAQRRLLAATLRERAARATQNLQPPGGHRG